MTDTQRYDIPEVRVTPAGSVAGILRLAEPTRAAPTVLVSERQMLCGFASACATPDQPAGALWTFDVPLVPAVLNGRTHEFRLYIEGCSALAGTIKARTPLPRPEGRSRIPLILAAELPRLLMQHRRSTAAGELPPTFEIAMSKAHLELVCARPAEARQWLLSLGDSLQRRPLVQLLVAECDLVENNLDIAARRFYEIAKAVPTFRWAYLGLIDTLTAQGKWKDAELVCHKLADLQKDAPGLNWRHERLQCLMQTASDAPEPGEVQRRALVVKLKQLLLIQPDDRRLSHLLDRLRNGDSVPVHDASMAADLRHHRIVLELVADAVRVAHG